MQSIHERLGDENLQLLVDEFYNGVFADPRINHLFTNDIAEIKTKQFKFLSQFFGGPPRYAEAYAAVAWLENMALAVSKLPVDEEFKDEIFNRFPQAASHMINR